MNNKTRRKRFVRDLSVTMRLTSRDMEIIRALHKYRFLNSSHIIALLGGSEQTILRRLAKLYHAGYIDRPKSQRQLFFEIKNHPFIYALGNKGAEILYSEFDMPNNDWMKKNREAKLHYLHHTLDVSNFLVCLRVACRDRDDINFIDGDELIRNRPIKSSGIDPLAWKIDLKKKDFGLKHKVSFNIIPDGVFALEYVNGDKKIRNFFFLEADRSTEPIARSNFFKSSFGKKIIGYLGSYKYKLYSKFWSFSKVRVITTAISQARINNIISFNREIHPKNLGYQMFCFILTSNINVKNADRILNSFFVTGQGEQFCLCDKIS